MARRAFPAFRLRYQLLFVEPLNDVVVKIEFLQPEQFLASCSGTVFK